MEKTDGSFQPYETSYPVLIVAGGIAGTAVDVLLFPLDTIKTRLQSENSLRIGKRALFKGLYSGLAPVLMGSAPSAALFFAVYETVKWRLEVSMCGDGGGDLLSRGICHMTAAGLGDTASCVLRVPVEIVKQRTQSLQKIDSCSSLNISAKNSQPNPSVSSSSKMWKSLSPSLQSSTHCVQYGPPKSSYTIFRETLKYEGLRGFFRGYCSMLLRELPFSMVQFPLWELLKCKCADHSGAASPTLGQSAVCAAVAGGTAAAVTTPLDVAKTRIMLAGSGTVEAKGNVVTVMARVLRSEGVSGLFSGLGPRMALMSVGGAIFLGAYDMAKDILPSVLS